ncbi:tryptophanyl-tRNA synthetase II [Bdellovibrio bacteriovorus str. Tiberius]|uniref:Tryptophan--tRNA ligase n=1 Tax=Bdellovibrio bacteriovorus str. Tiberius TaxID=1069642 RepID=K7YRH3_BDEBC|nr:tryptophanyl-tRNA synthetase II [Bdellovibrio bacteriovorus str. Tiberius]
MDLQDSHDQYIIIADVQALTDNYNDTTKVRDNILQVTLDYLAAGIDPAKSTIFVQSELPELFEMTTYFMNLVTVARLERNPTVKTEIQQKNLEKSLPAGFLTYPVSQAADILGFKANLVPAGEDQNPMIEQTNEIAQRFNHIYKTDFFKPVKGMAGVAGRLPGIDGKAKMSKSLGNAIYLSDTADVIKKKVQKMYTDPGHLKIEDPGKVEGNVVFSFLDVFDPRKDEVAALKEHYQRGGLGDGTLKVRLTEVLNTIIAPMRERREQYAQDPQAVLKICKEGSLKAQEKTRQTLKEMKAIMGVGI